MQHCVHPESIQAKIPYAVSQGEPLVVIEPPEGEGDAARNFTDEMRDMTITNARSLDRETLLEKEGFTLLKSIAPISEFEDPARIRENYYQTAQKIVVETMGASRAIVFDHNIRIDGNSEGHRKPAGIVHVDLTGASARRILHEQLSQDEYGDAMTKRFAFVNTWQPVSDPVYSAHLAFCASTSVPDCSMHRAELQYEDRTGELYYCSHSESHRWYYFPRMTTDEMLLFKNYDSSHDGRARCTPHTAIQDSTAPQGSPPRQSLEVRLIVLF